MQYNLFMVKKQKYYVVWEGRQRGVFTSWAECQEQISGFSGAKFKAFPTRSNAEAALTGNYQDFVSSEPKIKKSSVRNTSSAAHGPVWETVSVDAACSGNPGVLEYRGVDTQTGELFFHEGPFPEGTVNIGEFLAIVDALQYLQTHDSEMAIYSDSKVARGWVQKKVMNSKLPRANHNKILFQRADHALQWLKKNNYSNEILRWDTAAWGEIPADFGRK